MATNTLLIQLLSTSISLLLLSACTATKPVATTKTHVKAKPSIKHHPKAKPAPARNVAVKAARQVIPKSQQKRQQQRTQQHVTRERHYNLPPTTTTHRARSQVQAYRRQQHTQQRPPRKSQPVVQKPRQQATPRYNPFSTKLADAALNRTRHNVRYDGRYIKIGYPWGDVPQNIGVCTDVVIRSYRKLGIDLQQQVHQDMNNNFLAYPNLSKWKLKAPDPNIDHRRVYNLRVFLARHAQSLPRSGNPLHYQPGDIITWQLGPDQGHIGIVSNQRSKTDPKRFLMVHNIAEGPKLEDVLFRFPMSGHYRYNGKMKYSQSHYTQYKLPTTLPTNRETTSLLSIPSELLR